MTIQFERGPRTPSVIEDRGPLRCSVAVDRREGFLRIFAILVWRGARHSAVAAKRRWSEWRDRARSRRELLAMDDLQLQDIGIDRATARAEAGLHFWQLSNQHVLDESIRRSQLR